jgi:hypothetical protein
MLTIHIHLSFSIEEEENCIGTNYQNLTYNRVVTVRQKLQTVADDGTGIVLLWLN